MFKNALVSVTDKTGLAEFLKPYVQKGLRVVSTGGTAKYLKDNGIAVVGVEEQTGFPEVMDGRVRTLHPLIHMALLGREENADDLKLLSQFNIQPFDLVIGNLYAFEKYASTLTDDRALSEYIDIGGPALLRAAAKNYSQMTVLCDPADYSAITTSTSVSLEHRKKLAAKVFSHISTYDSFIARTLDPDILNFKKISFAAEKVSDLRYGENAQQKAVWFKDPLARSGLHAAEILQGKALSYNNILDLDAAAETVNLFEEPCCVSVKHNNPCGVAIGKDIFTAVQRSLSADPKSVFGGIIALNRELSAECAQILSQLFLECILAPSISAEARDILALKKNLRVMVWDSSLHKKSQQLKSIAGGYLLQTADCIEAWNTNWTILGEKPSQEIQKDLSFCWRVCSSLKSNAIAIAAQGTTVGLGMGQVNRVDSVDQAIQRMKTYHPGVANTVLASDAFFPFEDSIEKIAQAGIHWVIQPGGSVRDEHVIAAAKKWGVNLVFTGTRHFKH